MPRQCIYPTKPADQAPVCPHCNGTILWKPGKDEDRQRYICRTCHRSSYGVLLDWYLKCPACKGKLWQKRKPDGRTKFCCSQCGKCSMSEYKAAPREYSRVIRYRHKFALVLDSRAREGLVEYGQKARCTDAQAVRAIFRFALTGKIFPIVGTVSRLPHLLRVDRNPAAAAMRFPSLKSQSAKKKLAHGGGHYGRGFLPTICGVQTITVLLDDEAKEGLIHAMRRLEMNHADAARWLLTNIDPLSTDGSYRRHYLPRQIAVTSGTRISNPYSRR